jgi:hypothetical protein
VGGLLCARSRDDAALAEPEWGRESEAGIYVSTVSHSKELSIIVRNKENMKEVTKLWNMWNEEKRRDMTKDDDWHEIDDEEQEECIERTTEVDGAAQNSMNGPDWVEENHAESDHSQRATSLLNRNPADGDGEE